MKVLNFTCVDILPALLDKSKEQTIRPAWEEVVSANHAIELMKLGKIVHRIEKEGKRFDFVEKPARFKVGDGVKIMWDQRSKYDVFCKRCGSAIFGAKYDDTFLMQCKCRGFPYLTVHGLLLKEDLHKQVLKHLEGETFTKRLGNGIITEVFKIEMWKGHTGKFFISNVPGQERKYLEGSYYAHTNYVINIAKLDGFASSEAMFKYFDSRYELAQPRQFWVYRWKWL